MFDYYTLSKLSMLAAVAGFLCRLIEPNKGQLAKGSIFASDPSGDIYGRAISCLQWHAHYINCFRRAAIYLFHSCYAVCVSSIFYKACKFKLSYCV